MKAIPSLPELFQNIDNPNYTWGHAIRLWWIPTTGEIKDRVYTQEIIATEITEYHPAIFRNGTSTQEVDTTTTSFHPAFVLADGKRVSLGRSYNSLDESIVGSIAYKHDGPNSRAAEYFCSNIRITKEQQTISEILDKFSLSDLQALLGDVLATRELSSKSIKF